MGAVTIIMAQLGRLPGMDADEVAFYAAQPMWLVIATDIALLSAVFAAIALLLRRKFAFWLFGLSIFAIFVTNIYDILSPNSRNLADRGTLIMTLFIVGLSILQFLYSRSMRTGGVLR